MFACILTFVMLYIIHQKFATCLIPPFDSHIGWILLKGFSIWLRWQLLVPGKEPAAIKSMSNLGGKVFLTEDGFIGLFNFLKYKMVSLPLTLKPQFRDHEIIFSVPEMKMTFTVLNVEQTRTCTAFIWNEIGPILRQVPSLSIFKSNVLKLIRPQKKNVFNIYDPEGTESLFQLRVGLSPLRYHKKHHNFTDSPSDTCICGMSVETTEHFLIYCNLYNEVRVMGLWCSG